MITDEVHRFFEITTHTPWAATCYLSIKKVAQSFEVLECMNVEACLRAIAGNSRYGDVMRTLSNCLPSIEERLEIGKSGPQDRFERILDFGVKGVDLEPTLEDILDKVIVQPPRVRKDLSEEDLSVELEKVEAPPQRGFVKDAEFEAFLDLIK